MAIVLTREELYELVWSKPITKLAKEFKISDVALHKICRKHNIPKPAVGYWAKVAAGKKLRKRPLPPPDNPLLNEIQIQEHPSRRFTEKIKNSAETAEPLKALPQPDPSPHVERLRTKLNSAKPKRDGFIHIAGKRQFTVTVTPDCTDRATLTIDNMVREAQSRDLELRSSDQGLAFEIDGELIGFALTETLKRVPHEPTEAELRKLERWEEKYQRDKKRHGWASEWGRPEIPEFDREPSGLLELEINPGTYTGGIRRHFRDGKRQRIDRMPARILDSMTVHAAYIIDRREQRERERREWEAWEARRKELQRIETLEQKRLEFLERKLARLEQAVRLETFVANYEEKFDRPTLPVSCRQLLEWASNKAVSIRSEISPDRLASTLDKYQLMDDSIEISEWTEIKDA